MIESASALTSAAGALALILPRSSSRMRVLELLGELVVDFLERALDLLEVLEVGVADLLVGLRRVAGRVGGESGVDARARLADLGDRLRRSAGGLGGLLVVATACECDADADRGDSQTNSELHVSVPLRCVDS